MIPRFKLNWLEGSDKIKAEAWLKSVFETENSLQVVQNSTSEDVFCVIFTKKKIIL